MPEPPTAVPDKPVGLPGGANTVVSKAYVGPSNLTGAPAITPTVSTKFQIGDRVSVATTLNVRGSSSATGALLGTQITGSKGNVVAGPVQADGISWWNINYDSGVDGWSSEDYMNKYVAPVAVTPPTPAPVVPTPVVPAPATPTPPATTTPINPIVILPPTPVTPTPVLPNPIISLPTDPIQLKVLTLVAKETTLLNASTTKLSWNSSNVSSCVAYGGWSGSKPVAGVEVITPPYREGVSVTTMYTLSCVGSLGEIVRSVSITTRGGDIERGFEPVPVDPTSAPTSIPMITDRTFDRTLKKGTEGDDVYVLQFYLAKDKSLFASTPNGLYGPATERAVKRFQLRHGVVANSRSPGYGLFGKKTQAKFLQIYKSTQEGTF